AILQALRERDGQATGRLHTACAGTGLERRDFEEVLGGLARADLLRVTSDTFTKDGRDISFKRAWLMPAARTASPAAIEFVLPGDGDEGTAGGKAGRSRGKGKAGKDAAGRRVKEADAGLVATLKQWRLQESRRNGLPAFRVLTDRTLTAIAAARPQDEDALLSVSGMGPSLLKRYGDRLLALCRNIRSEARPGPSA
ncbi:MAG TPA: HRDC domain-containing protein, partial [Vicinamibacteria bacterium]